MLYDLKAFHLNATDYYKLVQHRVNNAFTKMLATKSNDIISDCQQAFDCVIFDRIVRRKRTFLSIYGYNVNLVSDETRAIYTANEIMMLTILLNWCDNEERRR